MDLTQLGNLGEFVSGIAVVASLIYVGIQIRQNTRATHAATLQELCRDMRGQFNASPVVLGALRKMSSRQELEFEEQYAWLQYTLNTFRMYENQWFQHKRGMLDDTLFRGYQSHIYLTLDSPSASAFWAQTKAAFFHPEFVAHVEELLKTRTDIPKSPMHLA